jgi:hypothetical protein
MLPQGEVSWASMCFKLETGKHFQVTHSIELHGGVGMKIRKKSRQDFYWLQKINVDRYSIPFGTLWKTIKGALNDTRRRSVSFSLVQSGSHDRIAPGKIIASSITLILHNYAIEHCRGSANFYAIKAFTTFHRIKAFTYWTIQRPAASCSKHSVCHG